MPQLKFPIIRFTFNTPLHVSNEKSDYGKGSSYLRSDALTAAIYFAWARLGKTEWIPKNEGDKQGFTISSLFPFSKAWDTGDFVYFLPRPMIRLKNEETIEDTKLRKKLKKVRYVDAEIFNRMLRGETVSAGEGNVTDIFRSLKKLPEKLVQSQVIPRAAVSRSGQEDTTIFYMERFYFTADSGLYAVAHYVNEEIEKRVKIAINFLSEEGLGTDRNIGNGKFTADFSDSLSFEVPDKASYGVNLGLYCPSDAGELKAMLSGDQVGYDIIKRGGWLSEPYNTWRKRSVYMFTEGSVFALSNQQVSDGNIILGQLSDVKPNEVSPAINHPVWRSGRSVFIPF